MNLTHTRLQEKKEKQLYTVKQVLNNNLTHTVFFLSEHQRLGQITNDKTQKKRILSEKKLISILKYK